MRRIGLFLLLLISIALNVAAENVSHRNCIFVLDCTKSMKGFNGAPDIWADTKSFLRDAIIKEAEANPSSRIVILPFQDKVLRPIFVNTSNVNWPGIENVLDGYVDKVTATNICDAWLAAEDQIDMSSYNYFYLLTDGHDNIGGVQNETARVQELSKILRQFCGKYNKTKGFYVELTKQAQLPEAIREAVKDCIVIVDNISDLYKEVEITANLIELETRSLPSEVAIECNSPDAFNIQIDGDENDFVDLSIVNNEMKGGRAVIRIEPKPMYGNSLTKLNDAIADNCVQIQFNMESCEEAKIIQNPEIYLNLYTSQIRALNFAQSGLKSGNIAKVDRLKRFLWIKGNEEDTLVWNLSPCFNEAAVNDGGIANFKIVCDLQGETTKLLYDGEVITDSIITVRPGDEGILSMTVPENVKDKKFDITLICIGSRNLDRINHFEVNADDIKLYLNGELASHYPFIAYVIWALLGLIILSLIIWFAVLRNMIYPKFKSGIITITSPYYIRIIAKGSRKIVFTPVPIRQSAINRIFMGKIVYHTESAWPCTAEVTPSAKGRMRFACPSGKLLSIPATWQKGMTYEIIEKNNQSTKIEITIN